MRARKNIPFNQSIFSKMKPAKRPRAVILDAETEELQETTDYNISQERLMKLKKAYKLFKYDEPDAEKLKIVEEGIMEVRIVMNRIRMRKSF